MSHISITPGVSNFSDSNAYGANATYFPGKFRSALFVGSTSSNISSKPGTAKSLNNQTPNAEERFVNSESFLINSKPTFPHSNCGGSATIYYWS